MNDRKWIMPIGLAVLAILTVAVAGCTQPTATPAATPQATATPAPTTKTITDMNGRTLIVPSVINSVVATSPPITNVIYMLAPDKLMAWNSNESGVKYIPTVYANKPVVGGWFGTTTGNYENFLAMNPDLVLEGFDSGTDPTATINDRQTHLNPIPVVAVVDSKNANNYVPEIRFLGDLLGVPEKADQLIAFYNKVYGPVNNTSAAIPADQKKRVYYAEGPQGLQTDPSGSPHSQLIDICGGINVASVAIRAGNGMTPVNLEQVLAWNPDVIIAGDAGFYSKIYSNSSWSNVKAVRDHQVYLIPNLPLGWFDRPPGVNSIIGIPWTAKVLYPDRFKDLDLKSLAKEFYANFYQYNLTDEEVTAIISGSGLKTT